MGEKMKRVLIIGETPLMASRFGTEIRNLGFHFYNKGIETACLGYNYTGWPFRNDTIPYPLYPWVGPPDRPVNVSDVLNEFRPDTLLLIGPPILFHWLKDYRKRINYRVVLHTAFKSTPLNAYMKEVYGIADHIIVSSSYEERILDEEMPGSPVTFIAPGMDIDGLRTTRSVKNIRNSGFRVACVAKDTPQMDFPALLKAFGIAAAADPRLIFGIFSDMTQLHKWNVKDIIDVYGIQERCTVMNPQPALNFGFASMGDLYATVDLLVLPHQEEALDITALEASYCGVPMIVPKEGPTREYMPDNGLVLYLAKNDVLFEPPNNTRYRIYDSEEIAEKILVKFLEISGPTGIPQKKQYDKKMTQFDWRKVSREWVRVLE